MTKKKAPEPAATGLEGQNPEGINLMSKATRKARAAAAVPGTVAADHRIAIDDQPEKRSAVHYSDDAPDPKFTSPVGFFSAEELETMPLTITNSRTQRVRVWRGPDGAWYRIGGWLRIQPRKDGEGSRFHIVLSRGANRADLQAMLNTVARTRQCTVEVQWQKQGTDWAEWVDDRTFSFMFGSRSYCDPYTHRDDSPDVTACTESLCIDRWHEEYDRHHLDEVAKKLPNGAGQYRIAVGKDFDDDGRGWIVDVYTDEFYGSAADVAAFVSDLQWMQAECERANQAVGA